MPAPLFSILIPSYNRPELIPATIRSVLSQEGCDFEVIVSDDASPRREEMESAVAPFQANARFCFIAQPRNLGWSGNRNALAEAARGEYVLLLGDDDLLPPGALARLAAWLRANPGCDVAAFGYEVISPSGKTAYVRHMPRELTLQVGNGRAWREVFYYDVLPMWGFHPFTLCCRRHVKLRFPYDRRCGIGDDAYFLFQLLDAGHRLTILPDVLFQWRRALQPVKGYMNLSSSQKAKDDARWAIWKLSQLTQWASPAVGELVRSPGFAKHFLEVGEDVAERLSSLARAGTEQSLRRAEEAWNSLDPAHRWRARAPAKLVRMWQLAGPRFAWHGIASSIASRRRLQLLAAEA
jgi:hypothetical protein